MRAKLGKKGVTWYELLGFFMKLRFFVSSRLSCFFKIVLFLRWTCEDNPVNVVGFFNEIFIFVALNSFKTKEKDIIN